MKTTLGHLADIILRPPRLENVQDAQTAELIYKVIPILPIAALVNLLGGFLVPQNVSRYLFLALALILLDVVLIFLCRRAKVRLASMILITVGWIGTTWICMTGGGIRAPGYLLYAVVILGGGILVGFRAGVAATIVTFAMSIVMTWLELHQLLPAPSVVFTPVTILINLSAVLGLILAIQYVFTISIDRALRQTQEELGSRREAESLATRHRAVLSSILDSTKDLIVAVDKNMKLVAVNAPLVDRTKHMVGFRPVVGMPFEDIIPQDRRSDLDEIIRRVMEGEHIVVESESPSGEPEHIYFEETYNPVNASDGSVTGFTVFIRNITSRRLADHDLQNSKQNLEQRNRSLQTINEISQKLHRALDVQTIAQVSVEALARYTQAERVAFLSLENENKVLHRIADHGFTSATQSLGIRVPVERSFGAEAIRTMAIVSTPDLGNDPRIPEDLAAALTREGMHGLVSIPLFVQQEVFGTVHLVYAELPQYDEGRQNTLEAIGQTIGLALANARYLSRLEQEILERTRTESALQASEERYRRLVENSNILVAELRQDGVYLFANAAHRTALGHEPRSLEGVRFLSQIHPDDVGRVRALSHRAEGMATFRFLHGDGTYRWLDGTIRRFTDSAGEERIALIANDITDRILAEEANRSLEAQLLQSQKLEAVGTLAGGIAHDFNNILVSLLGNAELARLKLDPGHPVQKYIDRLLEGSERARDLVRQILAFSRRQEGERKPVQPQIVVKEALKLLRASIPATIEIRTAFLSMCPNVMSDATQIHQVLLNLCTNAVHAMESKGGTLEVAEELVALDAMGVRVSPDLKPGTYYLLSVRDTGQGIDPTVLPRIFEPFFTTKEKGKGTGLGLSVVHGIVRSHDGAIVVQSEIGKGTAFQVYLPVFEGVVNATSPQQGGIISGNGEHLMIVDDEQELLATMKDILLDLGYRVSEFRDSRQALETFRAAPQEFDLVITDLTMPRMTGIDLTNALREIRPEIPIVLVTGYQQMADERQIRDAGIREIVSKPFRVETLAAVLHRVLFSA